MSGYDTTLNFGLKKPWNDQDFDAWGDHLNQNADAIDGLLLGLRGPSDPAIADIREYGGGTGGDDALAMRNAIDSGKKIIYVPPGVYTNRSVIYTGTAHAAGPTCWLFNGLTDTFIYAYGATFLMDNDSCFGAGVDKGSSFLQISNNCKNVGMFGGTLVGSKKSLSASRENCSFLLAGVTGLTLRDIKVTGTYGATYYGGFLTFLAGVFAFDSLIENIHGYNLANPLDISSLENVTFNKCFFTATTDPANNAAAANGVNCHYDKFTLEDGRNITNEDGSHRDLRFKNTNGLKFKDCVFTGFYNGIYIDSCQGALISKCVIRGATRPSSASNSTGIILAQGADAIALAPNPGDPYLDKPVGYPTTDVVIEDCEITGHAVAGGGGQGYGVSVGAGASGTLSQVEIVNCRIYDNNATGIGASTPFGTPNATPGISDVTVQTCDFASRTGSAVQTSNIAAPVMGIFTGGISFGGVAMIPATSIDLSKHIDLYNGVNGINITGGRINYISSATTSHCFVVGGTLEATISSAGLNSVAIGATAPNTGVFTTLKVNSNVGFYGATPLAKPTAGGAWAGNTAGKALSVALAALGLINDTSTA